MSTAVESVIHEEVELKTKSAPIGNESIEKEDSKPTLLKQQISAPSYLFSLKENDAPPFRKPGPEPRARLVLNEFLCDLEAVEMVEAATSDDGGLGRFLVQKLVEKKFMANYAVVERDYLLTLLIESIDYAAQHKFSATKLAALLTLYVDAHLYCKWYYWVSPVDIWMYFKESLIRFTVEDSPDAQEVFEPEEAYDILTHFHTIYMNNLPLIHILTFVQKFVEKKFMANYAVVERDYLLTLLIESIDYAAQHKFSATKLAALLYVDAHLYCKWYYWVSPVDIWMYFKESLIRFTVEDSPDAQEVFEPEEAYDILTHFHTIYMNNLPLIHILTFGAHRLKFSWPFVKRK